MLVRSRLLRRLQPTCPKQDRAFHQTPRTSASPNHYDTLGIPSDASPTDVKKYVHPISRPSTPLTKLHSPHRQFYALSKANHPDLHPNDPSKSKRFVAISEAYSVLGSPEKRQSYDRDFLPSRQPSSHHGSYSSHSPAGARPASGLSKRRTQFKGPPPSFYRSGGWGAHSEKRSQHATSGPQETYDHPTAPGTGPGGFTHGMDNDVPHFDQRGHHVRQAKLERSRRRRVDDADYDYSGGGGALWQFVVVSGVLGVIFGVGAIFSGGPVRAGRKREDGK